MLKGVIHVRKMQLTKVESESEVAAAPHSFSIESLIKSECCPAAKVKTEQLELLSPGSCRSPEYSVRNMLNFCTIHLKPSYLLKKQ